MNTLPKVAVIIVNHNGEQYLERCLAALTRQSVPIWRCIVVDNASTRPAFSDGPPPGIEFICLEQNLGFAAANNLAVRHAEGAEWIALLNPDAFPDSQWLEKLLDAAQRFPAYASFASRMLSADNPEILDGAGDNYHASGRVRRRGHGLPATGRFLDYEEVFSPCAAAALYRTAAFQEVGGFDEDLFCYLEDVDLGFRLRLLGYRCLYVPEAVVHHIGSAITGRRSDFSVYHGHRNLVWVFVKNMPNPLFWRYLPGHILVNILGILFYLARGQFSTIVRAKYHALKHLPRIVAQRRRIQHGRRVSIPELHKFLT